MGILLSIEESPFIVEPVIDPLLWRRIDAVTNATYFRHVDTVGGGQPSCRYGGLFGKVSDEPEAFAAWFHHPLCRVSLSCGFAVTRSNSDGAVSGPLCSRNYLSFRLTIVPERINTQV